MPMGRLGTRAQRAVCHRHQCFLSDEKPVLFKESATRKSAGSPVASCVGESRSKQCSSGLSFLVRNQNALVRLIPVLGRLHRS